MNVQGKALRADALLLLTAAIWGLAFVAQRAGMEHVGPFVFNGIRFALGCLTLVPVLIARGTRLRALVADVRGPALLAGLVLFLGASFQQVGIVYTTAGKAGFITGLYVVIVPLLARLWGRPVGAGAWSGALLAAAGMYLLSVRGGFGLAAGDGLVLVGALFWALHVLVLARWAPRVDPVVLALGQFATCSLLSLAVGLAHETTTLAGLRAATTPILYGGIASVGIAFTLQVVAQREAQPTVAAIVLSTEAVFAAIGGWLLLGEVLSPRGLLGCALMLAGVIVAQLTAAGRPAQAPVSG